MAFPWDPRSVLNIYPDGQGFTCVGTTKKGSRCRQSMISGADLSKASQILNTMTLYHPASRTVRDKLADLAYLTLCPRWHRKPGYSQVTDMVQKWQRTIENHCESTTAMIPITTSQRRPEVPTRTVPRIATSSSEQVRQRRAVSPSPESAAEERVAPSALRRSAIVPRRPTVSSTPPASPERSPSSPPAATPRTPTTSSPPELPTPPRTPSRQNNASATSVSPPSPETSRPASQRGANATPPLTPSTPTPPTTVHTPCSRPHRVTRKPITEDCGICYEPICCLDDAVWCRAQCGQNIHRECFRDWRTHCLAQAEERSMDRDDGEEENGLEAVRCVFCRASWRWEWQD
jgi:hypothetical protein